MQQQQMHMTATTATAPQRQQQLQQNAAAESSLVAEDAFDAVRQAAVTMFKQRTKDLTKLSHLQEQQQALEGQLTEMQAVSTELEEHQAHIEAAAEKEEHRAKERAEQLQALHGSLAKLSEDQRTLHSVGRATERVAAVTRAFVGVGGPNGGAGDTEGYVVRLGKLLEAAQAKTEGRTTGDFRNLSAELRRREAAVKDFVAELRRTGQSPKGLSQSVREWTQGSWRPHKELAAILLEGQRLLGALLSAEEQAGASGRPSRSTTPRGTPNVPGLDSAAAGGPGYAVVLDDDALFHLPEQPDEDALVAARSRVEAAVSGYNEELHAIRVEATSLSAMCEENGVSCEVARQDEIEELLQGWSSFLEKVDSWLAGVRQSLSASDDAREQAAKADSLEAMVKEQQSEATAHAESSALLRERQASLEAQIDAYATAWRKAYGAGQAQVATLADLEGDIARTEGEVLEKVKAVAALKEESASVAEKERAEIASLQEGLELSKADAVVAAEELSAAQGRHDQSQLISANLQARMSALEAALGQADITEEDLSALLKDAAATNEARDFLQTHDVGDTEGAGVASSVGVTVDFPVDLAASLPSSEELSAFESAIGVWDGLDMNALQNLLPSGSGLSALLRDGDDAAAVVHTALQEMRMQVLAEQEAASRSTQEMADIAKETQLLQQELS